MSYYTDLRHKGIDCQSCEEGIRFLGDNGHVLPCPVCGEDQWDKEKMREIYEQEARARKTYEEFRQFLARETTKRLTKRLKERTRGWQI